MMSCEKNVTLSETCTCSDTEVCEVSIHDTKACVVHNGAEACFNVITDGPTTHGACAPSDTRGIAVLYIPEMDCVRGSL